MHIQNNRKVLVQNHLHGRIQIAQIIRGNAISLVVNEHGLGIDREPNMVEIDRFDEGNILRRSPGVEMFFGVTLRVVDLREPVTEIDSVAEMLRASMRNGGILGKNRRAENGK